MAEDSITAIEGPQHPNTGTQLLSFSGLRTVFRGVVRNIARIGPGLKKKLQKHQHFNLGDLSEDGIHALHSLQRVLTTQPVFMLPRAVRKMTVDMDADKKTSRVRPFK